MNVRKRGLALLMCICMIFTLLPFSVFAEDQVDDGSHTHSEANGVVMDKRVEKTGEDTYKVTLEQYVTGTVTPGTVTPIDVVLVLDVSGSMTDPPYISSITYKETYSVTPGSRYDRNIYYVKDGDSYKAVKYCSECNAYADTNYHDSGWPFYVLNHTTKYTPMTSASDTEENHVQFYDKVEGTPITKLQALKNAVNSFIDTIAAKNKDSKIAIVKFASDKTDSIGNEKNNSGYNYTQIVKNLTAVNDTANVTALKKEVNDLESGGATQANWGLEKAQEAFGTTTATDGRQRVVIMFTDGVPTSYQNFDNSVANGAISAANTLKKSSESEYGGYDAKVYTIAVYNGAEVSETLPSYGINRYMHLVSSNYPNAIDLSNTGDGNPKGGYYKVATNEKELSDAFTQIGDAVGNPAITLGSNAVLTDNVAPKFKAPANTTDVKVYTEDHDSNGNFSNRQPLNNAQVSITGQNVTVTGFDYSANYVSTTAHPGTDNNFFGKKLIVEFTITVDRDKTYGGTQPTNAAANISRPGDEKPVASVPNPEVPVAITNGFSASYSDEKVYSGTGFDVKDAFAKMLAATNETTNKPNGLTTDGNMNDYVDIAYEVKFNGNVVGTYTVKAGETKGNWNSDDPIMTGSDVATYVYNVVCKVTDANGNAGYKTGVTDGTGTMTLTVTPREVTLTSESATKAHDGTPLTKPDVTVGGDGFVDGEVSDIKATGTVTNSSEGEVTNTIVYTKNQNYKDSNYSITKNEGKLSIYDTYTVTYKYEYENGTAVPETVLKAPVDANSPYRENATVNVAAAPADTAIPNYTFMGWFAEDDTQITAKTFTMPNKDVVITGKWAPINTTYTIECYWLGDTANKLPASTDGQSYHGNVGDNTDVTEAKAPSINGYTFARVENITLGETENIVKIYYYKNIELTANSGEAKYDGTLKTADGFKAIVAADNGADIYDSLKEVLAAYGEGTDAGKYEVHFVIGTEIIPVTSLVNHVLNNHYLVTKATEGELIISRRSLTITSASDSKYYDGTPLTNNTIKVTGDGFVTGEGATYNVTGSQTKIGSSKNTFDVIFKDNTKATNYVVEKKLGDLTVNRRPMPPVNPGIGDEIIVEITGSSDSVVYDGAEHNVKGYTVKISDPRYTEKDFTFTGKAEASGVNAGTYEMGLKAEQFKNTNARFTNVKFVIKADGVLTITPKELTITAGSKTEYGPTPVTCDEWTVSGLAAGDKVESVKITGIQSVPGSSPNVPSDAVIKNAKGEDVTKNYAIKYVNGTLTMLEVLNKEDHFNYIIGTPEGLSLPTANVTRAEVATIFFRLMTDDARAKFDSLDNSFSDVAKGKWYNRAISTLAKAGIIKGDPAGTYRPGDPITRAEMAAIIARFGDFKEGGKTFSDISGHWAQKYIELAASNGWINGNPDGTFKPNNNITRAETVAMINRVLNRQTESNDDLLPVSQMTNWSDNMDTAKWYYRDMQEATNNHKAERVGTSMYEKWTEKLPDIDWASYQI